MGGGPGDALALGRQGRTFQLRGLARASRDSADRGKALSKFVVKLACEMPPFFVLNRNQLSSQRVALRERRLEPAGKLVEHFADRRQLGKIEVRQTRRKVAGGKAFKTGVDRPGRAQGVCERCVNQ